MFNVKQISPQQPQRKTMAINDAKTAPATPMAAAFQQAQVTPQSAPASAPSPMSFMNMGLNFGLGRAAATHEALNKAMAAFKESVKKGYEDRRIDPSFEIALLALDSTKGTGVRFSGIIVATVHKEVKNTVAIHTVLVEGSADPIMPKIETARGVQYEVMLTAGDTIDQMYVAEVRKVVEKAYPGFTVINADAQVLHRDFNFEDINALRTMTENIILPTITGLVTSSRNFPELNLGQLERDSTLAVQRSFNEGTSLDYSGHPVRTDVKITMSSSTGNKNSTGSLNGQEQSRVLATIGGYIDTVWDDNQQNLMALQQPGPKPKFSPRFIMTTLENQAMQTIPAQLLALAGSMILREGNNWFGYFTPRRLAAGAHRVDRRDVGALNIEGNISNDPSGFDKLFDTKDSSFDGLALQRLIMSLFKPDMYFSLRVSEAGADTWYNSVFKAAADGNPNAINAILAGANTLTNGNFQKFYTSGASPVLKNEDRVHAGYWLDNGVKSDLADIDYIAVMNLVGRNDPTVGAAWTNTFYGMNEPLNVKMAARWKMINEITGGTAVLTGYSRLVTFTQEFIDAFGKAVAATGLTMRQIGSNDNSLFQQRAGAGYLAGANVAPAATGLFNSGFSAPASQGMGFGAFNQRW
jgi:hypothetical protein